MNTSYVEISHLIVRLQRCFLDAFRTELNRVGVLDLTPAQALLLWHIGDMGSDAGITIRDLIKRGCYQGANISYNIKKLTDLGYLQHERCHHDRRSVMVRLTAKARTVSGHLQAFEERTATALHKDGQGDAELLATARTLRAIERTWTGLEAAT